MSDTPPAVGQDPWGADLNTYLASLEARLVVVETKPDHITNSYAWQFSSSAPPATGNQLRLNNSNPNQATQIDVRKIDSDGADRSNMLSLIKAGSIIRINDWDNAAVFHRYTATAVATFDATNAVIPVAWHSGAGLLPNAKINVSIVVDFPS